MLGSGFYELVFNSEPEHLPVYQYWNTYSITCLLMNLNTPGYLYYCAALLFNITLTTEIPSRGRRWCVKDFEIYNSLRRCISLSIVLYCWNNKDPPTATTLSAKHCSKFVINHLQLVTSHILVKHSQWSVQTYNQTILYTTIPHNESKIRLFDTINSWFITIIVTLKYS